jgi:hypothetical protein
MMGYQEAKVVSIVNKEILARIDARKRKEQINSIGKGHREPARRDWVNVSYEQKDEAKRLGCRWCPIEKRWYASLYVNSKQVEILLMESREKKIKQLCKWSKR